MRIFFEFRGNLYEYIIESDPAGPSCDHWDECNMDCDISYGDSSKIKELKDKCGNITEYRRLRRINMG